MTPQSSPFTNHRRSGGSQISPQRQPPRSTSSADASRLLVWRVAVLDGVREDRCALAAWQRARPALDTRHLGARRARTVGSGLSRRGMGSGMLPGSGLMSDARPRSSCAGCRSVTRESRTAELVALTCELLGVRIGGRMRGRFVCELGGGWVSSRPQQCFRRWRR
jgi:hypothetical protein